MNHYKNGNVAKLQSAYGSILLLLDLGRFFGFLIFYTVGLLGWGISPSQGSYLHTDQHKHRINAYKHPDSNARSQPFQRAKTDEASSRAATVIGQCYAWETDCSWNLQ
jgi:hypothetical protein